MENIWRSPAYEQGNIGSFLSSYVSEANTIQIGPRDMIYLFELASSDPTEWWFDMQDLVVIVTYDEIDAGQGQNETSQSNGHKKGRKPHRKHGYKKGPGAWRKINNDGEVRD